MMTHVKRVSLLLLMASCATVRPITYPSPCLDRGAETRCMVLGYEVWGSPDQIHAQARECPDGTRGHVTIDPHKDYGVVRCTRIESDKRIALIVELEKDEPPPPPDMEISLKETEAPPPIKQELSAPPAPPEHEVRDQPRVPPPKATRAKRKRRARLYND